MGGRVAGAASAARAAVAAAQVRSAAQRAARLRSKSRRMLKISEAKKVEGLRLRVRKFLLWTLARERLG